MAVALMPAFPSFDGVELHYEIEGEGPPVVCLHGIIANYELNWRAPGVAQQIVDAGFRVIGPDARGHGRSEKPHESSAYSDDAMAKDVVALLDHLGLEQADVVGYSMGAAVSMRLAALDDRVRRFVLGGFGGRFGDRDVSDDEAQSRFADAFDAPDIADVPEELRPFRLFAEGSGMDMDALRALVRSNAFRGEFDASRLKVPTLVICGDEDVSPHELAAALPDGRSKVISGNHFSAVLDPALGAEIVSFLQADL